MKKLAFIALCAYLAFNLWDKFGPGSELEPLQSEPYIAVYGRTSCGYTTRTLQALQSRDVNVRFYSVDDRTTADLLHARMEQSGISTRRYNLPVVDVNGQLSVRPAPADVLAQYHRNP